MTSCHDHGNCELCDQQETDLTRLCEENERLQAKLKRVDDGACDQCGGTDHERPLSKEKSSKSIRFPSTGLTAATVSVCMKFWTT